MPPEPAQLTALARDLIAGQSAMTLATAGDPGAWAAAVYYAFFDHGFFFFSSPTSRHIQQGLDGQSCGAAISAPADTWQGIRGLQMSGRIHAVSPGLRAARAIKAYAGRFPFVREFFSPGQAPDLEAFTRRFKVRLYEYRADLVYYLDNSLGFGFREPVEL